ncbi:MAG: aspartate-alanine antiporter [Candidatus Margulisbacteria bacterium]|nr:aspartate-alanine antiporter [Candidatus Margulisiibacteriota bacterium]
MVEFIVRLFQDNPQLAVFLAIAIGYFVGKIKFFGFNLGSTAGVLLAALLIGQMDITVYPLLKAVGFALFIFTIGYKVGPQFFGALKKEGVHYIWLSLVVAATALATAVILAKLFGFDRGTAAGLLGGAMTQSSIIGTADGAIKNLAISGAEKAVLESNVAIAYAITYIFGVAGLIVFFKLIPKLLRIDLKKEAADLVAKMSDGPSEETSSPELFSWQKDLDLRVFELKSAGKKVSGIEKMFSKKIVIEMIKRADKNIEPQPDFLLQAGDKIALLTDEHQAIEAAKIIGPEVDDGTCCAIAGESVKVCLLNKEIVGKPLGKINQLYGQRCFLKRLTRAGHELPLTKGTVVNKCDVLEISGSKKDVEAFVNHLGYAERATIMTDLIMVGLGCLIGTLAGLLAVNIAGIPLTLGIGGGVLLSGLIFGWLRSVHPTFGQIPGGAQWIFTDLGLNLFIACVGLTAGPRAWQALQTSGGPIFIAGVILSLMPMIVGLIFGKYVLKLNPVLLLGALTGAGTVTPALNALKESADSSAPALAYAVPYAFGNVILTIWGTIIIHLV